MKVEQNVQRLKYLLKLYKLTVKELLELINGKLKNPITSQNILGDEIKLTHLKRIDSVFEKGLHFYLDPKSPEVSQDASIFFRKDKFDTELNIGAKKIVNQFEDFKISLSAIAKLAELNIERKVPIYTLKNDPKGVAKELGQVFYPRFTSDLKDFLKALISKFADNNILVFEFVETWNKKNKANIDGFFLNPNVIVLKRHQIAFRREIFTLIHELGHYLLNKEEIEELEISDLANHQLNSIEQWCNDFAFYFLAGDYANLLENLEKAGSKNDYHHEIIGNISKETHLSKIALYTRLLLKDQISPANYRMVKDGFEEDFARRKEDERLQRELDNKSDDGRKQKGSTPKPINSPLLVSTIQTAFNEGLMNEYEVCKTLNISPDKLDKFLQ